MCSVITQTLNALRQKFERQKSFCLKIKSITYTTWEPELIMGIRLLLVDEMLLISDAKINSLLGETNKNIYA